MNYSNWQALIPDSELDNLAHHGFIVVDECFSHQFLQNLQLEGGYFDNNSIDYQQAHLTHGERLTEIRGDSIRWIDESCPKGMQYLQAIEELGQFFNRTLFTGIRYCEAHYARYPVGFGYQWHSDNPKGRDERILSAVFYLNDNWGKNDGGEISLVDKQDNLQKLMPKANRLIVFDSNLQHQVEITKRQRFSIATWMRRD